MARSITAKLIEGPHELRGKRIRVAVDDPANPPTIIYVRWRGRAMWDFAVGSREQPQSRPWKLGYVRRGVEADNNGQWTYSFQLGATDPLDWTRWSPPQLPRCIRVVTLTMTVDRDQNFQAGGLVMSTESLNYVLVKVSERGDLSQLAELESELLKAFPSRDVLWTGGGVPQSLAEYAESEGIANVSSDFRSADWLQPEIIYVALVAC